MRPNFITQSEGRSSPLSFSPNRRRTLKYPYQREKSQHRRAIEPFPACIFMRARYKRNNAQERWEIFPTAPQHRYPGYRIARGYPAICRTGKGIENTWPPGSISHAYGISRLCPGRRAGIFQYRRRPRGTDGVYGQESTTSSECPHNTEWGHPEAPARDEADYRRVLEVVS